MVTQPNRAEMIVMTTRASRAPENTINRGCLMAMMAAMKKVLSPNSDTIITESEATNPCVKPSSSNVFCVESSSLLWSFLFSCLKNNETIKLHTLWENYEWNGLLTDESCSLLSSWGSLSAHAETMIASRIPQNKTKDLDDILATILQRKTFHQKCWFTWHVDT